MVTHARPLDIDDAPEVAAIDRAYARAYGLEPRTSEASLRFFARSGHAFVAEGEGGVLGFVLAQPVFDGERPTLLVWRLASPPPGDAAAVRALTRALTKSAYDAGIYDVRVDLPDGDASGAEVLEAEAYGSVPTTAFARHLGSRAAAVAAAREARGEEGGHG
ncbi:MAG TPA: DUF1999 family protein [Trueperaceae bacterium]|nr:DUF1999 family protein [Trueperaceae bacterium]